MQIVRNPKSAVFSWDYRSGMIRVSAEPSLYFDTSARSLYIDQNPAADRSLTQVRNTSFSEDFTVMRFDATWHSTSESFEVTGRYQTDRILRQVTQRLLTGDDAVASGPQDVIEVHVLDGTIAVINVLRVVEGVVEKSIRITHKDGRLHLVVPSPWKRTELTSVAIEGSRLVCRTPDEDVTYELSACPLVVETMTALIDAGRT
ncbi:hypothetical protein [Streptomyces gardneri]|uniref:Uncharacterized protein n=1 Tax=Streptomyces gardneri TaxID=66892 RepID=A0A4Y3RQN0_9ACTN|nr:hypothetical protein [Streptomyces gardneri]GEB60221.1 hypothetical protein SGA01_58260 [Streptomyces gardneri]GHH21725.1 hypothetical protein GCM10017674_76760 [Streptomyces gardneri]